MAKRFAGQVVWITGASSGIGEALARAFALEGATLVLSARRAPELERVARSCLASTAPLVVPLDLEDSGSLAVKADEVIRRVGRIDVLVHNAGISQRGLAMETSLAVDRRIMEVNYFGVVALTKAVLPHMLRVKGGKVVVVSSLVGLFGTKLRSAYGASKHALHGFFEALDQEHYDDGLRVTMVCPGFVRTNISQNALRGDGSRNGATDDYIANGLAPEDAADQIVDAVAREARMVTPAGKEILGAYLKRIAPGLLSRVLRKAKVT